MFIDTSDPRGRLESHFIAFLQKTCGLGIETVFESQGLSLYIDVPSEEFRRNKIEANMLSSSQVYSGPSGLFQKHVDTPRSQSQIGSLVVCLPSMFKGGNLLVRHHGAEVNFDWAPRSGTTIQWAALYSDCEHEIKTITEGERVTLTYNLYVAQLDRASIPSPFLDPTKLSLYPEIQKLFRNEDFMKNGIHPHYIVWPTVVD